MIVQLIYFLMLFLLTTLTAMDFNDGMKEIRSYDDFFRLHLEAHIDHARAIVAYRVDRHSRFYTRCNPILNEQEQKLMSSTEHTYPRVHYAIIEMSTYEDLPPSLFSYTYFSFFPILAAGAIQEELKIVDSIKIARCNEQSFLFPDGIYYFDKTNFRPGAYYFPKRKKINVIQSRDNLRMRAITGVDALILLKWFQEQTVSVGWQDQSVVFDLKKKFEQDFGFSYESRETMKQKIC